LVFGSRSFITHPSLRAIRDRGGHSDNGCPICPRCGRSVIGRHRTSSFRMFCPAADRLW
jgi:hypothetical protein